MRWLNALASYCVHSIMMILVQYVRRDREKTQRNNEKVENKIKTSSSYPARQQPVYSQVPLTFYTRRRRAMAIIGYAISKSLHLSKQPSYTLGYKSINTQYDRLIVQQNTIRLSSFTYSQANSSTPRRERLSGPKKPAKRYAAFKKQKKYY